MNKVARTILEVFTAIGTHFCQVVLRSRRLSHRVRVCFALVDTFKSFLKMVESACMHEGSGRSTTLLKCDIVGL